MYLLHTVVAALSIASLALGSALSKKRATVCNGRAELCNRGYGEVTFLGAHNSFAASQSIFALARNQELNVVAQLNNFGTLHGIPRPGKMDNFVSAILVRRVSSQLSPVSRFQSAIEQDCILFDGGLVVDYLKKVKTFLDENPNEVLTLLFTNPDGASIRGVWKPAFDQSGIAPLAYVPPHQPMKRSEWPTLGQLIDSGKRVIVFLDSGADNGGVDFILPEFKMIWEPPFSSTDPNFPCRVDRTEGPLSAVDHMYMLNHNLNVQVVDGVLVSDRTRAPTTNSVNSIIADANGCRKLVNNQAPNFVMLDFVNVGEGKRAVDQLNGF
ncbi:hypothetical protein AAF712_004969 [Marasmius tenuissimus]|uniref:PLC-like phosphodiesterase n=1 Tax=Marasmius tenuissimus TaxID=585030 RepID=A0ABR3A3F1_9AGAR